MNGEPGRRKEPRHKLCATAILVRKGGRRIVGSTVNVSGGGVLLEVPQMPDVALGEEVGCSIQLYEGKPPQAWGVGKVVRLENCRIAIEFTALD